MSDSIPHRLSSLTIVLPFYNDAGTVNQMISDAYTIGARVTNQLTVIAIHGGASTDDTYTQILRAQSIHPDLQILDESRTDAGYAVIVAGLKLARTEWVFYTDGDAQYHLDDLTKLVQTQMQTGALVINGYKLRRHDLPHRIYLGALYALLVKYLLRLPIRDPHCDFRLIHTSLLTSWTPRAKGAAFIQDLIIHLKQQTPLWAEVGVHHYSRSYGRSNYSVFQLMRETIRGILQFCTYR